MNEVQPIPGTEALEIREIKVAGIGCDNCARKVESALRAINGVKEALVDRIVGRATVTFDPTRTNVSALSEVIVKSGYHASAVEV